MDEEKQIEEMAKEIQKSVDGCANYWAKLIATYLYEQGYRNVKDKVVLDKEEFDELQGFSPIKIPDFNEERENKIRLLEIENNGLRETFNRLFEKEQKVRKDLTKARKETAREILATIKQAKENGQIYYNESFMITAQKAYGVKL
jgi:hypothetical protein